MGKSHFDVWAEKFKPQTNHLRSTDVAYGCFFETYGAELEYVRSVARENPLRVWTVVEGDSGKWYVGQGYHLVNRIGYLITEHPYDPDDAAQRKRYFEKDTLYA